MKIIVPASMCIGLAPELRKRLWIIPQKVQIGGEGFYIDKYRLDDFAKKQQFGRFVPVPLGEIAKRLDKLDATATLMLIAPSATFDTTPYGNIITSVHPGNTHIHPCALNCYGSAFTFLLQGILQFVEQHHPTPQQLKLFIERINDATQPYLLTNRTKLFEANLSSLAELWHRVTNQTTVYAATELQWKRSDLRHIAHTIRNTGPRRILVWVDVYQAERHARVGRRYLRDKNFARERLVQKALHYANHSLPQRFALLTVVPGKAEIDEMGRWAIHYA